MKKGPSVQCTVARDLGKTRQRGTDGPEQRDVFQRGGRRALQREGVAGADSEGPAGPDLALAPLQRAVWSRQDAQPSGGCRVKPAAGGLVVPMAQLWGQGGCWGPGACSRSVGPAHGLEVGRGRAGEREGTGEQVHVL